MGAIGDQVAETEQAAAERRVCADEGGGGAVADLHVIKDVERADSAVGQGLAMTGEGETKAGNAVGGGGSRFADRG